MNTPNNNVKDMYLSPSSINCFNQCPKKFWYHYFERLPEKPSINLVKGSAVHYALETLFDMKKFIKGNYKKELFEFAKKDYLKKMVMKDLEITDEEKQEHLEDGENIIRIFINRLCDQIDNLLISKKASSPTHAFHLLKPQFRELKLSDSELKVRGVIDTVQKDFDDNLTLVDYKTSNKYKNVFSNDYKLQLAIYAYLYKKNEGVNVEYLCINYLRFGESFYIDNTPDLIRKAIFHINNVRLFIQLNDKEEQYFKQESKLCEYCSYYEQCFGKKVEQNKETKTKKGDKKNEQ